MPIQSVIKYEGDNNTLIYKHPDEDFNTLSKLIVHESQEAVFFSDGKALDSFRAGQYTLETKNIPIISKLRNLVTGGENQFHSEVYFINLTTMMDIPWGTPSMVTVKDPNYAYNYNAGASGSFALKIIDGRNLLINLVGTESEMTQKHVQKYFKDLLITRVKNHIAVELSKYSFNEINQRLDEISESLSAKISGDIESFGIQIFNFFVSAVNIAPEDLNELKELDNSMAKKRFEAMGNSTANVIEAEGFARAREIQGFTWQQEQQFDVSKTFAANEGFAANPANMMAQVPIAFSMGEMMRDNISAGANAAPMAVAPQNQAGGNVATAPGAVEVHLGISCPNCGASLAADSKFCSQCGTKIEETKKYCAECGSQLKPEDKFCSKCGKKVEE